jgi:hypothetical protein
MAGRIDCRPWSSIRPAMVATAICGVRAREHGRRWGVLWCCSACQTRTEAAGRGRRRGRAAVWWGRDAGMVATHLATRRSLKQKREN